QAEDGIRDRNVTGVQTCALPIYPESMRPVPHDGETPGELLLRGNTVMKGYLKSPESTRRAFAGGWFHTGDVAVVHPDGYVQITRSEEHTSELQSRFDLVCRLLLE